MLPWLYKYTHMSQDHLHLLQLPTNSTFSNNNATNNGGALANIINGSMTISNSTFNGNTALNGGAIVNGRNENEDGTINISRSNFNYNSASNNGGAIANIDGGIITIDRSNFTGNTPNATANIDGGSIIITISTIV